MKSETITVKANGEARYAAAGSTLPEFLAELGLAVGRVVVERNGAPLTPTEARKTVLAEGDRLEIVKIVAGG